MLSFNLVTDPWIPVLWQDGKVSRIGIFETLVRANQIRTIAASNPMDRMAVMRFLLAVLYWCKGNPTESLPASTAFPASWFEKLKASHRSFELLGGGRRFYQFLPSVTERMPEKLSANYLIQEVPTGSNHWHFRHSTDKEDGLCLACCAFGLLRLPLFSTSGGRGKPPGINAKPPMYVLPIGVSLAETLLLSWQPTRQLGLPIWETPALLIPQAGEVPLLTGFTWVPRRVWLGDPTNCEERCVACGDTRQLIKLCTFAGIGSTKTDEDSPERLWRDPHVLYTAEGSLHASDALGASDAAAGQWTKTFISLLRDQNFTDSLRQVMQSRGISETHVRVWVVGFATVQNDKYLEAWESTLPVPSVAQSRDGAMRVERWQKESASIVEKICPSHAKTNRGKRRRVEIRSLISAIRPHVEHVVSANAGRLLAGRDADWEQAANAYAPMMVLLAQALAPGMTATALQRRKALAAVRPTLTPRPSKKKGGAQ